MIKKILYINLFIFSVTFSSLWADSRLYLESARHFLLNPAWQDSCISAGTKFYNSDDKVSEHHLTVNKMVGKYCFSWDSDYLYFTRYKRLKNTVGANHHWSKFMLGNDFSYWQDSEDESKMDGSFSLGVSLFALEHYLICTSLKDNQWAAEFRKGKQIVLKIDDKNFLLSTDIPFREFSRLQISLRKSTIAAGLKFFRHRRFVQFSTIYHRYVEPDYLLSVGAEL